jgi:hypothetical protein
MPLNGLPVASESIGEGLRPEEERIVGLGETGLIPFHSGVSLCFVVALSLARMIETHRWSDRLHVHAGRGGKVAIAGKRVPLVLLTMAKSSHEEVVGV